MYEVAKDVILLCIYLFFIQQAYIEERNAIIPAP